MIRWLAVCIILAAGTFALVAAVVGRQAPPPPNRGPTTEPSRVVDPPPGDEESKPAAPPDARPLDVLRMIQGADLTQAVTVPNCTVVIAEQQEVPSPRDGILVFIGTDKLGDPTKDKFVEPDPVFGFLAVKDAKRVVESFPLGEDAALYRPWRPGDRMEPGTLQPAVRSNRIRKLQIGDWVEKDQLVALVDPRLAFTELAVQVAKLDGINAEYVAAGKLRGTAKKALDAIQFANRAVKGSVSLVEELRYQQESDKAASEEIVKAAGIRSAQAELNKALTALQMHEIRSKISGQVKVFYKNHEGDAVKANEAVLQIQNPNKLRVEGLLEVQEALSLTPEMTVQVEVAQPVAPRVLAGHFDAVTCVAVSKGKQPTIVSGGDDKTLRGWDPVSGQVRWLQELRSVPRAVACTPPGAASNLLLVGDASGVGRLFDLDDLKAAPRTLAAHHQGVINSVAFSPDGSLCATAGDDHSLCLWNTKTGEQLYREAGAHIHEVTFVQFAGPGRLVSAGRDNALIVWNLEEGRRLVKATRFDGRSDDVTQPGVSPDGKFVLFDQGRELKVCALETGDLVGKLVNPSATMNFSTMALFGPDGKTILTNMAAPGKLQLWRAPIQGRASELRQLIWNGGVATCGAFAPEAPFAVTGTQDHQVLVWALPSKEEAERPLTARLSLVEKAHDTRNRQVRVHAELDNPGWIIPGGTATIVIPPKKAPGPLPLK